MVLTLLLCLFYSHRIGGPSRKISEALDRMAHGDLWVNVKLREADLLHDVARSVNVTSRNWRKALREIEWVVAGLRARANTDQHVAEQVATLEDILKRFKIDGDSL